MGRIPRVVGRNTASGSIRARANPSQFGAQAAAATAAFARSRGAADSENTRARRQALDVDAGIDRQRALTVQRGTERVAQALADRLERDQIIEAKRIEGETANEVRSTLEELKTKVPEGGDGYTDLALQEFDEITKKAKQSARSTFQREALEAAFAQRRLKVQASGEAFERQAMRAKRENDLQAVMDQSEAELASDPSEENLKRMLSSTHAAIDAANIDANRKRRLKRTVAQRYAKISVSGLVATNPGMALAVMQNDNVKEALGGDIVALKTQAEIALDEGTRREKAERKVRQDMATKEGTDLLYSDKLTPEWLEQNRGVLTSAQYGAFSKALHTQNGSTDPALYADLINRAGTEPGKVMEEATDLFANGKMQKSDFDKLYGITRREGSLPRWHTNLRSFVQYSLKPSRFDTGPQAQGQQIAMIDFDEWALEHPNATFDEARKKAEELIEGVQQDRKIAGANTMPLPRGVTGNYNSITVEQLNEAKGRVVEQFKNGDIGENDMIRESELIEQWMALVETRNAKR